MTHADTGARLRSRLFVILAFSFFSAVMNGVARAALPPFATPTSNQMRAHFIDVGQGSAVLLEFRCGVALIDTGGEKNTVFDSTKKLKTYLDRFFARRPDRNETIDLLVLTHAHIDHTRGVNMILRNYTVRSLVDNGLETGSGGRQQRMAHTRHREGGGPEEWQRVRYRDVSSGTAFTNPQIDPIRCSGTDPRFSALWGALGSRDGWPADVRKNGNDSSVVLRVDFGQASFLFPGDLEEHVQQDLVALFGNGDLDIDVYHVSHHGSHNGTTESLMRAMSPQMAIISMGPANRVQKWSAFAYGHPRTVVLDLLTRQGLGVSGQTRPEPVAVLTAARGAPKQSTTLDHFSPFSLQKDIYGTGWSGTIVIEATSAGALRVHTER